MSNINLSNTTPAAASGRTNVQFANDASNNVSGSMATPLVAANNLSDVATPATARTNLGAAGLADNNTFSGSATFSGAAQTFSTPANLVFGSGWMNWTPTVTAAGSMTLSGITVYYASYIRLGPLVFFMLEIGFTIGGTASNTIYVTAPLTNAASTTAIPTLLSDATTAWTPCVGQLGSTSVNVLPPGQGNYPLGGAFIMMSGFYHC